MKRVTAVFLFGFVIVLFGTAQSGMGSASLGAGLEGASVRHSSLPFGTRLKVVNPETNREIELIVTGRLPADSSRSLEISEDAAAELGMSPEEASAELRYQVQILEAPATPAVPPAAAAPVPAVPPSAPAAALPSARIIPCAPDPESTRVYRVQVGSYKSASHARAAFDRLNGAGFHAAYERFGDNYRVVIPGVPAADIQDTARRLGAAGFSEIWIRPER
ncbi:MAG: SPOR domain-containing protein [Spirochaetaceae bacterium]|nr:SPOR domain-containing protein [Spirochaetaceae bacterium]